MEVKIGKLLQRYADLNFYIDYDRQKRSDSESRPLRPAVTFFRERTTNGDPIPIKVSRGEENMPNPTPVVIMGRLAVDKAFQGKGLGRALLKDALLRITKASELVGARAVLVHAVDQDAVPFYANYNFRSFPVGNQSLFLPIDDIVKVL